MLIFDKVEERKAITKMMKLKFFRPFSYSSFFSSQSRFTRISKTRPIPGIERSGGWNRGHQEEPQRNLLGRPAVIISSIFGIFGIYYFTHREIVPVSGRTRFITVSKASEIEMGNQGFRELFYQFKNQMLPRNHPDFQAVSQVAFNLIKANGLESYCEWEVFVVNNPQLNAFVLPNGKIFVFTGILPVMKNRDGVAAVLGHEIAHVTNRHTAEKLSWISLLSFARFGLALIGLELPHMLTSLFLQFGFFLPNSRACESEADQVGLEFMSKACYDPREASKLWKRMKSLEKNSATQEWLSTHPSHDHRISDIEKWMEKALATRDSSHCNAVANFQHRFYKQ